MAKYTRWLSDDGLLLLTAWARDGLNDEQIAARCGITKSTLYEWKKRYSSFSDALKTGKEPVDIEVENTLLKRALGYECEEVKEEYEYGEMVRRTVTKKNVAPDTTAIIFWLKNRRPAAWRDRQQLEHSGHIDSSNPYAELTAEQLRKLADDG